MRQLPFLRTLQGLMLAAVVGSANALALSADEEFTLFLDWFEGEYDYHEQVWQQGVDEIPEDERLEHIHHRFDTFA